MNEIDYSEIKQPQIISSNEEWEPPVHKYFGKKLPNGKTEKEPVYTHQEYPRLMYAMTDGKIKAREVNSEAEKLALGEGWEKTPAAFGYIGAPSFEETLMLKDKAAAIEAGIVDAPKRGRPAKVD